MALSPFRKGSYKHVTLGSRAGVGHVLFPAPHGLACIQPFSPPPHEFFYVPFPCSKLLQTMVLIPPLLSSFLEQWGFPVLMEFASLAVAEEPQPFFTRCTTRPHVLWRNFSLNIMPFSPRALRAFPFVWEEDLQSNWCLNLLGFPPSYFFSALGWRESISCPFSLCSLFFLRL